MKSLFRYYDNQENITKIRDVENNGYLANAFGLVFVGMSRKHYPGVD